MDIDHILKLSRLKISDEEKKKLEREFSSTLGFVKKLRDIDVSGVEPLRHIEEVKNAIREDKILKEAAKEDSQKLVNLAPDKKEDYIKTKQIL